MMSDIRNRRGIVIVRTRLIESVPFVVGEAFHKLKLFPTDIKHVLYNGTTRYYVMSENMDVVKLGDEAPEYELVLNSAGPYLKRLK